MKIQFRFCLWVLALAAVSPAWSWAADFLVTSAANVGAGSLREAVALANASPGPDVITFDAGLAGSFIASTWANNTYTVTDTVTIDGGDRRISIGCGESWPNFTAFSFQSGTGSVLKNLAVVNSNVGVQLIAPGTLIAGCRIGTDWSDSSGRGNAIGIQVLGSGQFIGNTVAAERNVISGNSSFGIMLGNTAAAIADVVIRNCYIGTNASGTAALPNGMGIYFKGDSSGWESSPVSRVMIGGNALAGEGNLISGNSSFGIYLADPADAGNTISGNVIGLNADQSAALGNSNAIMIHASHNAIGLPLAGYGNVIAGHPYNGIMCYPNTSGGIRPHDNTILNNLIGVSAHNTVFPSSLGILMSDADSNRIGSSRHSPLWRNVIAGNTSPGIVVSNGNGNTIAGNYIGLDTTGEAPAANTMGINVSGQGNLIGGRNLGPTDLPGNVVSASLSAPGIFHSGNDAIILGNLVGLSASGAANSTLANYMGIYVYGSDQRIGDGTPEGCNYAAGNSICGIMANGDRNRVQRNSLGLDQAGTQVFSSGLAEIMFYGNDGIISDNRIAGERTGIRLEMSSNGNTLTGNLLGVRADGSQAGLSFGRAIELTYLANHNFIGLPGGPGNLIAHAEDGIYADGDTIIDNGFFANTIVAFSGEGIHLLNGANGNKVAPAITSATSFLVQGTAAAGDHLELFLAARGAGVAGGSLRLAGTTTADESGNWSVVPAGVANGQVVTVLATDTQNNTSPFAVNVQVIDPTATPTATSTVTPTVTPTPTASPTSTASPTATPSPTITQTPTNSPTATASPTSTITPTVSPTATQTPTAMVTSTPTPVRTIPGGRDIIAYPDPGRERITFWVRASEPSGIKVSIYNFSGEKVRDLTGNFPAGVASLSWDCRGHAPGIYLARITVGNRVRTLKVALTR